MIHEKDIYLPEKKQSYSSFKKGTKENIFQIFDHDDKSFYLSLENFLRNSDHGLLHEYNVFQKAIKISETYEKETGIKIRKNLIYAMAICHDSIRNIVYRSDIHRKQEKEKRNDRNHESFGTLLFKKSIKVLKDNHQKDFFSNEEIEDIIDYLKNHDYFSEQLNGGRFTEPKSIEGQIVRLADRISIPLKDEINRYRDTGKRLGTSFFNSNVPINERMTTSFDKFSYYDSNGRIDEVLFFTALLMITSKDFSDPLLGSIYEKWAKNKKNAAKYILEIGKKEGATLLELEKLESLLQTLGKKFGFTL